MDQLVRVIATMVFDDTVPLAQIMMKSLRRNTQLPIVMFVLGETVPSMGEDRRLVFSVDEIWKSLHERVNRGVNDKAKALMFSALRSKFGTEEMFYIDADCLILKSVDDVFRIKGSLLLALETHNKYKGYLEHLGYSHSDLTFNAGVMLMRENYFDWWCWYYENTFNLGPDVEGQLVWNAVWHAQRAHAEVLPQRYNQLHVRDGPDGAMIYHLAGMSQNMKLPVMENLYKHFYGEEI